MGFSGDTVRIGGTDVVGRFAVSCIELVIHKNRTGQGEIIGTRMVFNGDSDPPAIKEEQKFCNDPARQDGHNQRVWGRIGVADEGGAGKFFDRIGIVCNTFALNTKRYQVQFRDSSNSPVPEGTPLQISWRTQGVKPELAPNLQFRWELLDSIHSRSSTVPFVGTLSQPAAIKNACSYALQPCAAVDWTSFSSGSAVTFNGLPPAAYRLRLTVRSAVAPSFAQVSIDTVTDAAFEITPNR